MKTKHVLRAFRTGTFAVGLPNRSLLVIECDADVWAQHPEFHGTLIPWPHVWCVRDVEGRPRRGGKRVHVEVYCKAFGGNNYGPDMRAIRRVLLVLNRDRGHAILRPARASADVCRRPLTRERRQPERVSAWCFTGHGPQWLPEEKCGHCGITRREYLPRGFWPRDDGICPPCRVKWLAHCAASPL